MTTPTQAHPKQPDQTTEAAPDFAVEMHQFWEKNRRNILLACVVIVVAVAGYQLWQELQSSREQSAREAYAAAAGSPAKLTAFANEYSSHRLAAVALLQVADASYAAGEYATAGTQYQKAAGQLTNLLLKSRARLGAAISKQAAGDVAGAETDLKTLGADTAAEQNIRAEALYNLATQLQEAGRTAEVRPLLDQIAALDTMGVWGQRASQLKATLLMNETTPALGQKP